MCLSDHCGLLGAAGRDEISAILNKIHTRDYMQRLPVRMAISGNAV